MSILHFYLLCTLNEDVEGFDSFEISTFTSVVAEHIFELATKCEIFSAFSLLLTIFVLSRIRCRCVVEGDCKQNKRSNN